MREFYKRHLCRLDPWPEPLRRSARNLTGNVVYETMAGPTALPGPHGGAHRPPVTGASGVVSSAHYLASLAGARVLMDGGNAVDAAVATAATLNVVEPFMSGMAGVGYMMLFSARTGEHLGLDFMGRLPQAAERSRIVSAGIFRGGRRFRRRKAVRMTTMVRSLLVLGLVLGAVNGFLVAYVGLPSLAVTIGTLALYRGLAEGLIQTDRIAEFPAKWQDWPTERIGSTNYPMIVIPVVVLAVLFGVLLHFTSFGRGVYEIGLSPETAHFSGVDVRRSKLLLFMMSGVVASFAGIYVLLKSDSVAIDALHAAVFPPDWKKRAAAVLREGVAPDPQLSFVATMHDRVVASVRLTPIAIGKRPALLLGPLVVSPDFKGQGGGRALVRMALDAARTAGHKVVMLVGDLPYYGPLGFRKIARGQLSMPRPVDLDRILAVELKPGAVAALSGMVDHEDRVKVEG